MEENGGKKRRKKEGKGRKKKRDKYFVPVLISLLFVYLIDLARLGDCMVPIKKVVITAATSNGDPISINE